MNQPSPQSKSEHKEVQRLLNEVKTLLAQSKHEGKKLEWEIDEFLKTMWDINNIQFFLRETGPYINKRVFTDADNPNRDLHKYWNGMRDGYGGI